MAYDGALLPLPGSAPGAPRLAARSTCLDTNSLRLYDFVNPAYPDAVLTEMLILARDVDLPEATRILPAVHADILRLFRGDYPGYRASNTAYHDLEHTMSVVLATGRMLHGCSTRRGYGLLRPFMLGIVSAYYHDVGLIQKTHETEGTGAQFTVGHEQRSIDFMRAHLNSAGLDACDIADIESMIRCTILSVSPDDVQFSDERIGHVARIMGSADLIAQIADRNYLEKLLLLFKEFEEAGLPGYGSALDLLRKTGAFYANVAKPRLDGPLHGLQDYMLDHFRARWRLERDLYRDSIERNLGYLELALDECGDSFDCLLARLNRAGIAEYKRTSKPQGPA